MPYVPRPAQASLDTEGLRRFNEEEYREIARAWSEKDASDSTTLAALLARLDALEAEVVRLEETKGPEKNYIINGAMMVSQENGATAGTSTGYYAVDQFFTEFSNAGTSSTAQVAGATSGGSPNRLRVTVTLADAAVAAGDYSVITQRLEGLRVYDLRFGSAAAKQITLQFGCKAPAGTYCVAMRNSPANRAYVAEYVVAAGEANTDVIKTVTLTADTTGVWATDNTSSLQISWTLMCGSTFQTAAGSWAAGLFLGSSSQFNFMGTNGNVFELFDVSLTEGSVAPPFVVPDFVGEMVKCQRYFRWLPLNLMFYATGGGQAAAHGLTFSPMRTVPAIGALSADLTIAQVAINNGANTFFIPTTTSVMVFGQSNAAGQYQVSGYRSPAIARL